MARQYISGESPTAIDGDEYGDSAPLMGRVVDSTPPNGVAESEEPKKSAEHMV